MSHFDQQSFNKFIAENGVYGFFEKAITLKSGRLSHFYANWRNVVEDAWLTGQLIDYVLAFVHDNAIEVDTFYGVPEGATKLGILTQYKWATNQIDFGKGSHILSMGRAKPKDHGAAKDKYFVGAPRGKVVVLEDVTTTGGSMLKTLDFLKESQINVVALISLTNRMEVRDDGLSVRQAVERQSVAFFNMSTAPELLPLVYSKMQPGEEIGSAIEAEFDKYGVEPVKLI